MSVSEFEMFQDRQRSNWVRLRTLVTLRWFAAIGQAIAIFVAIQIYDLRLPADLAALAIGASLIANLLSSFLYPENKRLSERQAFLWLVFDIVQLSILLYLTGGLSNPFALLILAPVAIAATVLHLSSMIFLGLTAITLITLLSRFSIPIETAEGVVLVLPILFQFGFWTALVIGVVFLAIYARQVTTEMHAMGEALVATQLALAREQKLTDLGGVVAAAAHELGTPLATIKLVGSELMEELKDHPELLEDAALIRDQADRCRDILHSMGRAGKDDLHLRHAPLETLVHEAAEPHMSRGRTVLFDISPEDGGDQPQPSVPRRPEIIHGLRNLVQNAVDFADGNVWVESKWDEYNISVRIVDDGDGYPAHLIGRIGDPFMRQRKTEKERKARPEYEGMGLGLFIAKTLLERSGAELSFANGSSQSAASKNAKRGAIVAVVWPRKHIDAAFSEVAEVTGENQRNPVH